MSPELAGLPGLVDGPLVVLTGAGLSTDSGIPDYRGPGAPVRMPMTYQEFVSGPAPRQRYWARSHVGWGRMRAAAPNPGHRALVEIAPRLLITQNVDGLHEAAGASGSAYDACVVALHGRISEVVCLECREVTARADLQRRMEALNPDWSGAHADAAVRPDGDVDLEAAAIADFRVPDCLACGGILKPHVVFFGENVPAPRVERCYAAVESLASDTDGTGGTGGARQERPGTLLVVGSSLTVMSGLRFVKRAARIGVPVVIVNRGATRGDEHATLKVEAGCSEWLTELAAARGAVRAA